jgi:prophage antirepressor-like protein
MKPAIISTNQVAFFQGKEVRKTLHQDEWWFAVVDVVGILTDSSNPQVYWRVLKKRLVDEGSNETVSNCNGLKMPTVDGKMRILDCANTENILRIIQSIPSPKAEPFKRWLAQVGYERVKEIENPELATQRTRELYKAKGYSEAWIEKRMRGIEVRDTLTGEWEKRGVRGVKEYSILTAEISKATFGMTPAEYKQHKGLKRENLRDHMTDLELIFSMLGEASTTEIARNTDAQGFHENQRAAKQGGAVAGNARKELEIKSGKKVITSSNYLKLPEAELKNLSGDEG